MTTRQLKDDVVAMITSMGGCKAMDLIASPGMLASLRRVDPDVDFVGLLEDLVNDGELIEIEYVLDGSHKVRSFYLPGGTDVTIRSPKMEAP